LLASYPFSDLITQVPQSSVLEYLLCIYATTPGQWFSTCGAQTSSISTTWKLVRNANLHISPKTSLMRNSGIGAQQSEF
jgi:hypothetical protein